MRLFCAIIFYVHAMYAQEKEQSSQLIQVAQSYMQFVHDVGSARSVQLDDRRVATLFAKNLTKIDNRTTLFANDRQLLLPQMKGFEKEDNPQATEAAWTIDIDHALIVPSVETNSVVVHFEWKHVHVGNATTMAILQLNENGQIKSIIDVWAKVQK